MDFARKNGKETANAKDSKLTNSPKLKRQVPTTILRFCNLFKVLI